MYKGIKSFFPLVFALVSAGLYFLIYRPAPGSEDFSTACLVFFTALGGSAMIYLLDPEQRVPRRLYVAVAIISPPLLLLGVKAGKLSFPFHHILFGLIVLAFIALHFFVAQHRKDQSRDKKD